MSAWQYVKHVRSSPLPCLKPLTASTSDALGPLGSAVRLHACSTVNIIAPATATSLLAQPTNVFDPRGGPCIATSKQVRDRPNKPPRNEYQGVPTWQRSEGSTASVRRVARMRLLGRCGFHLCPPLSGWVSVADVVSTVVTRVAPPSLAGAKAQTRASHVERWVARMVASCLHSACGVTDTNTGNIDLLALLSAGRLERFFDELDSAAVGLSGGTTQHSVALVVRFTLEEIRHRLTRQDDIALGNAAFAVTTMLVSDPVFHFVLCVVS
jgi:hypothetical protein